MLARTFVKIYIHRLRMPHRVFEPNRLFMLDDSWRCSSFIVEEACLNYVSTSLTNMYNLNIKFLRRKSTRHTAMSPSLRWLVESVIHSPCIYLVARRTLYTCTWGPWIRRRYRASRERGSDRESWLFGWQLKSLIGAVVVRHVTPLSLHHACARPTLQQAPAFLFFLLCVSCFSEFLDLVLSILS